MRKYEYVERIEKVVSEWKCDVCGLDLLENENEGEEAVAIHGFGGYSSIFGDGSEYCIDMCQHCFNKILGEYINIVIDD